VGPKPHLLQVLHWSRERHVGIANILAAAIAVAGPVLLAASLGRVRIGLLAAVGTFGMSELMSRGGFRSCTNQLLRATAPAACAGVAFGAALLCRNVANTVIVLLVVVAALAGGLSRSLAVATARFTIFLAYALGVAEARAPLASVAILMAGAAWAALVNLSIGAALGSRAESDPQPAVAIAGLRARMTRWTRRFRDSSVWSYPLRIGVGFAIAALCRWRWPDHHYHWIAVTLAILTQRHVDRFPVKTTQRMLGTCVGAAAATLFVAYRPPLWLLSSCVVLLAGARPLLKARNYMAYAAAMIPLIMLVVGAGQPVMGGVLWDRLVATVIGSGLVLLGNTLTLAFATA